MLEPIRGWLGERFGYLVAEHEVPGAAVAVLAGDDIAEAATGVLNIATGVAATTDSVFQLASVTKMWTATLVMQLVDEGLLDLDRPVRTYLPGFRVTDEQASAAVTPRHLLSQRPASTPRPSPRPPTATPRSPPSSMPTCRPSGSCSHPASATHTTTPATRCSAGSSRCCAASLTGGSSESGWSTHSG